MVVCNATQFFTDFSSGAGWSPVSNDVGGVSVTGGQLTGWGSDGGITREIFYDLVVNNGITISDTKWIAEFDFQYTVPSTSNNPGHSPFTLSDSTATTDSFQTAGPATPSVPHPRSISMTVNNFNAFNVDRGVQILVKDTTTSVNSSVSGSGFIDLDAFANTTVYPRLERTSATTYKLSVFTDSARTTHVTGTASGNDSPVTLTSAQVVTSTNFIHSSNNSAGGAGRVLTGFMDNLSITSGDCGTATIDAFIIQLGVNGCSTTFLEDFSTSVGWVQTGTQVTISGGTLNGWGPDGTDESQIYDLQGNDGKTLSDTRWVTEFKFRYTAFGSSTGHTIISLADSSGDVSASDPTGVPSVSFGINKQVGPDPTVNGLLSVDDGVTSFSSTGIGLEAFISTDLFVRLERISTNTFKLSVATDFAQTSPLAGSPVTLTEASFSNVVGLDHIQSRTGTSGSPFRNITGTVDDLAIDAGCPTISIDSILVGPTTLTEVFQIDSIVANINSSQLDLTWQYREHETNAIFAPRMTWTDITNGLRMLTTGASVGSAYTLKTFRLDEITGSDIKVTWERTLGNSGQGFMGVYDGTINAESLVDIPSLGGIPNTLLGSFLRSAFFPKQTDTLLAANINYAGATGQFITVLVRNNDGNATSQMALDIFDIQVGTRFWDFVGVLVITDVRGTQQTDTVDVDDFGYINASSVFSRFSTTFSIDARLTARTCSPWKKFNEADGSATTVVFNAGDAQGHEIPPVNVPTTVTGIKCSVSSNSFQGSVRMRIATFPQSQTVNGNFATIPNGNSTNQVLMNTISGSFSDFTFTFDSPCLLPGQRYMIVFDDFIGNSPGMSYKTILTSTKDYRQYAVTYQDPGSGSPPKFARVISINRAPAVDIEVGGESTLICPLISAIIVDEATWEFREARATNANIVPPPNAILTTEPPRLRVRTESSSQGNAWLFKSFKKTDIDGSSIVLEGDNNGNTEIKVYDGQYQRDRFGHFEPANQNQPATPLKGIGLLGSISANPLVTSLTLPAGSINYAGSTEEFITVFINNRDQVSLVAQNLDISKITISPLNQWNFELGTPVSLTSPLTSVPPDAWISTDPGRIQNPNSGSATFMMVKNGSNSTIAQDFSDPTRLGVTLGTNWRLRTAISFSNLALTPTGSPNDGHFCVTDQDQTVNCIKDSANSIGLRFRNETSGKTVALYKKVGTTVTASTIPAFNFTTSITHVEVTRNGNTADIKIYSDGTFTTVTDSLLGIDVSDVPIGQKFWKWGNDSLNVLLVAAMTGTLSLIDLEATPSVTTVTESTAFGGETDWGFARATSTQVPFMDTSFSIDACVGFFAGSRSRIGDIIILCLRAFPNSTGQEVVDHVNDFTKNNGLSFVGTTSRVKNWIGFLESIGFIQEDNSDPDWYETKWISLV